MWMSTIPGCGTWGSFVHKLLAHRIFGSAGFDATIWPWSGCSAAQSTSRAAHRHERSQTAPLFTQRVEPRQPFSRVGSGDRQKATTCQIRIVQRSLSRPSTRSARTCLTAVGDLEPMAVIEGRSQATRGHFDTPDAHTPLLSDLAELFAEDRRGGLSAIQAKAYERRRFRQ